MGRRVRRQTTPRRQRSPDHGVGFNALFAAVVLSAVRDAVSKDQEGFAEHDSAFLFLRSDACGAILEHLNLPDQWRLLNIISRGLPAEQRVLLGKSPLRDRRRKYINKTLASECAA